MVFFTVIINMKKHQWNAAQVLSLGFASLIVLGTLLLLMPFSVTAPISLPEALFTATSAVCVTGLTVLDTSSAFTAAGQAIILLLIQVGGLGFMLFATFLLKALGRRISLKSRMLISESAGADGIAATWRDMLRMARVTLAVEGVGALLLLAAFVPRFGWATGAWYAVFHSVSAFCNAGFDLLGKNGGMAIFHGSAYMTLVLSLLIIFGGIGYAVLTDTVRQHFSFSRMQLHTRLVLIATGALLLVGFVLFLLFEGNYTGTGILDALFQSVTTRTAGFSMIDQGELTDGSKLIGIVLMFIGASPASTGGGVKTTTVLMLLLVVVSTVKAQRDITVFGRRLSLTTVRTAVCIVMADLFLLLTATLVMTVTEAGRGVSLIDLMYETASALFTVGLTASGTPHFTLAGRLLLVALMYIGRVGPMTVMLLLSGSPKRESKGLNYPEEHILIG